MTGEEWPRVTLILGLLRASVLILGLLLLLLVKGSLVELLLLQFRRSSLELNMALLLVVGANFFCAVGTSIDVGWNLADTSVLLLLEVLRVL